MEKKDRNYFVCIDSDFLFDFEKRFKSRYTPWVYLYIKLEKNYFLDNSPGKSFYLNTQGIGDFLKVERTTIYRCINELLDLELLIKNGLESYRLKPENHKKNDNYIKVYKNSFIDIFENGGEIEEARVYYYMIQDNRHYAFEQNFLPSGLSKTKISKILNYDPRKTKNIIEKLIAFRLIGIDEYGKFYTKSPNINWEILFEQPIKLKTEQFYESMGPRLSLHEENDKWFNEFREQSDEVKHPEEIIYGWFKTKDGQFESPIIKCKIGGRAVDSTRRRKSDGKPLTQEQWDIQVRTLQNNSVRTDC